MQTINNKFPLSSIKSDGASFSDLLSFSPSVMFDFLQTPWPAAPQTSLSFSISRSLLKLVPTRWAGDATQPSRPLSSRADIDCSGAGSRSQEWPWLRAVAEVKVREDISNQHDSWSPPWLLLYSHQGENLPTKFASKRKMQNVEDWLLHVTSAKPSKKETNSPWNWPLLR